MTDTKTQGAIAAISASAKTHTADERMVRTIVAPQWIRQGDINVQRVADDAPRGKPTTERQLAPGTSKGSRHTVSGEVRVFEPAVADPLTGPIIESDERFVVEHPEHANVSLPSGTYAVTYQRDFAQEERARVQD